MTKEEEELAARSELLFQYALKHAPFEGLRRVYHMIPEGEEDRRRIYKAIRKRVFSRNGERSLEIINWLIKETPIPTEDEAEQFVLQVASRGMSFIEGRAALLSAMLTEVEKAQEEKIDGK